MFGKFLHLILTNGRISIRFLILSAIGKVEIKTKNPQSIRPGVWGISNWWNKKPVMEGYNDSKDNKYPILQYSITPIFYAFISPTIH
jgi:hypothetical protein